MEHQVSPQTAIMHIIAGYWLSRSVYLAARLKLADAIGDAELARISHGGYRFVGIDAAYCVLRGRKSDGDAFLIV